MFWDSFDEPAWSDEDPARPRATPESLARGYELLTSLDARHPVYLNHAPRNTVDTLRRYNDATDVVCVDIYPVIPPGIRRLYALTPDGRHGDLPNQTPSAVGEYVDKMQRVARGERPVFVVLQAFAWEALRTADDRALDAIVYPSLRETRFMAYDAITHGVNGLLYWGLHSVPRGHPFLDDLISVLSEITTLMPALLGADLPAPSLHHLERGSSIASGIEVIAKRTGDAAYLIAVNSSIDPAAAEFRNLPDDIARAPTLTVIGEDRQVMIANGSFIDEFDGFDVHVYRDARTDDAR